MPPLPRLAAPLGGVVTPAQADSHPLGALLRHVVSALGALLALTAAPFRGIDVGSAKAGNAPWGRCYHSWQCPLGHCHCCRCRDQTVPLVALSQLTSSSHGGYHRCCSLQTLMTALLWPEAPMSDAITGDKSVLDSIGLLHGQDPGLEQPL